MESIQEFKKCNACQIDIPINQFATKQSKCRACRAQKETNNNRERWIESREIKRKEFRDKCFNAGEDSLTQQEFDMAFIKKEDLPKMKKQTHLYSFCEAPTIIMDYEMARDDFKKGYILDMLFIDRKKEKQCGSVWII